MSTFVQLLLTGLMVGGIYGLVAIGFVLIYKGTRIFNFAQGELLMLGAFFCWAMLVQAHMPLWASVLLTFAFAIAIGFAIERTALRPMLGQPILSVIMMTLALSVFLSGLVTLIWGGAWKVYPSLIPMGGINFMGFTLSQQHLFGFVIALLTFAAFTLFFRRSRYGLAMRATAEDQQVARSSGVKVTLVFGLIWAIAALVSAVGGILLGTINGVNFTLGQIGLKAIPAALIGGLESIGGAIVGGLIIGVLESLAAGYIDPLVGGGVREIFPYVVLVIALLFRPYGIFGLKRIERV